MNKPNTHSQQFFEQHQQTPVPEEFKPILITDHFNTPENIGSIVRLGANIGAKKIINLVDQQFRTTKVKKTAGAAYNHLEIVWTNVDEFQMHIPKDYSLIGLETHQGATSVYAQPLPQNMALVLGNEKLGITPEIINLCTQFVYIPMPGSIQSMNVSHAAAVCLFKWWSDHFTD